MHLDLALWGPIPFRQGAARIGIHWHCSSLQALVDPNVLIQPHNTFNQTQALAD